MGQIAVTKLSIDGLLMIEPTVHEDARGFLFEAYNQRDLAEAGFTVPFVQDNQLYSKKGVVRGLHFQKQYPQGKLIRVLRGAIYDVAVDLRPHSPTFGQWYGVTLSAENKKQFYIPEGFAHGFAALEDGTECLFKVTDFPHPNDDAGLMWSDPNLAIAWPIAESAAILSEKDRRHPTLKALLEQGFFK